jgi:hypothetical protein
MDVGFLEKNRLLLPVISAFSYGLGALTIAWVMAIEFHEGALDRVAVRFWAFAFSFLVWLLGAAYASGAVSPAKQLRWWPISILLAALHGGMVVLGVVFLGSGGRSDMKSAAIFVLIGAIAAAFSYAYFLIIVWIIGKRAALPERQPPF